MKRLLLDTHVWLWYLAGAGDLPDPLREEIDDAAGSCWLSPVSVWEVGTLRSKGRVRLSSDFQTWLDAALASFPLREAALNVEVARRAPDLELPQPDPADRFLAATALVYDLTLVTMDRRLVAAPWLETLSA